jgi:hypothetical protein
MICPWDWPTLVMLSRFAIGIRNQILGIPEPVRVHIPAVGVLAGINYNNARF